MAEKHMRVPRMNLGSQGLQVSTLGLGCMRMSGFSGPPPKPEPEMVELIHHAINSGVTFLDTSDNYGPHTNELLIGKALKAGMREKVEVATKCGSKYENGEHRIYGDPAYIRSACEASLKRLGVDYIDLFYLHRIDRKVPIEISVGEIKKLVEEGKIKYYGVSEASPSTIRRAHAVHPISAVQLEWSLWARDVEQQIIPTCRELGIGIVVYSPLGRGFFSSGSKIVNNLAQDDFRKTLPRFQPENLEHNNSLFEHVKDLASRKECTTSQIALAWIYEQGNNVCPIPGTSKIQNLNENIGALGVKLSDEEVSQLDFIASSVKGERYQSSNMINTWSHVETPPLSSS